MSTYEEPVDPLQDRELDVDVQEPAPTDTTELAAAINEGEAEPTFAEDTTKVTEPSTDE